MDEELTILTPQLLSELEAKQPEYQREKEAHLAARQANRLRAVLTAPAVDDGVGRLAMTFRTSAGLKVDFEQIARTMGMPLSTATRRAMTKLVNDGYDWVSEGDEGSELAMTIRISAELKETFERFAKEKRISISAAMRWAMRGFIEEIK